jgi:hypothetical protein
LLILNDEKNYDFERCAKGNLGEKLSEMILGRETQTLFADLKFQAIPLYTGKAWFRPMLSWYYSLLDKLP